MSRILIVDDSPIDRMLAIGLFRDHPAYEPVAASDGREALALLSEGEFDAVVTDIQMPEIDGLELLTTVGNLHPRIPVILMTAKGSEELATEALELGAASYVPKRRLASDLLSTVDRVCCLARQDEASAEVSDCLSRVESEYSFPSRLDVLMNAAGSLPRGIERFWHCKPTTRMQLSVAIEEALTNAYFYGSLALDPSLRHSDAEQFYQLAEQRKTTPPYCDRRIRVVACYAEDAVEFTIEDSGPGFDARTLVDDVNDASDLANEQVGRGIRLMKTFMDEVRISETGNRITLVKQRTSDE